METGIQIIAKEREEQLTKHSYTVVHDQVVNSDGQLEEAIIALLGKGEWPSNWRKSAIKKLESKTPVEKWAVIGAWAAALIDARLDNRPLY